MSWKIVDDIPIWKFEFGNAVDTHIGIEDMEGKKKFVNIGLSEDGTLNINKMEGGLIKELVTIHKTLRR